MKPCSCRQHPPPPRLAPETSSFFLPWHPAHCPTRHVELPMMLARQTAAAAETQASPGISGIGVGAETLDALTQLGDQIEEGASGIVAGGQTALGGAQTF